MSDEDPDRTGQSGAERPDDPPNPPFSRSPQYGVPPQYGQGQRPYGDPPPDYGPPTYGPPATYGQPPGQYGAPPGGYGPGQYGVPPPGAPPWGQQPYGAGPGPGLPTGTTPARLGDRLLARIIDGFVLLPISIIVFALTYHNGNARIGVEDAVGLAVQAVYEIVMISRYGATVGKRMRGIKVVRLQDGSVPSGGTVAVRWGAMTALIVFGMLLFVIPGIAAMLSPTFDKSGRRQAWWDKAAGTIVIRSR